VSEKIQDVNASEASTLGCPTILRFIDSFAYGETPAKLGTPRPSPVNHEENCIVEQHRRASEHVVIYKTLVINNILCLSLLTVGRKRGTVGKDR
jgi:hypothetical protein